MKRKDDELSIGKKEIGDPGINRLRDRPAVDGAGRRIQMAHVANVMYNILCFQLSVQKYCIHNNFAQYTRAACSATFTTV